MLICFIFFFQAEDGIRDLTVTGVQTCALPIYNGKLHGPFDLRVPKPGAKPSAKNSKVPTEFRTIQLQFEDGRLKSFDANPLPVACLTSWKTSRSLRRRGRS